MTTTASNPTFTGNFYSRDDEGYESARVDPVFSSLHSARYPAAILRAANERDIVEGVKLAKDRGWQIGLRSGGHSFPMWGVRDDALLIDLGDYKEMSYDPETGIVVATTACEGGNDLNAYLKQFGRFFPGGLCPSVGLGGFLLQGGIGWNHRGWGWSAEQIVALDVVTAEGELIRADEHQNADLFWAARGCGPGFPGVVVRFHLQTRPIPKALTYTRQFYRIEQYPEIVEWLGEAQKSMHKDIHLLGMSINPEFEIPGHTEGFVFVIWAIAFCDTDEEAQAALAPLGANPYLGDALLVEPPTATNFDDEYAFIDLVHPRGLRYRVQCAWLDGTHREIAEAVRTLVAERPITEPGYTFFQYTLPRQGPDIAMSLMTDLLVGAYIIYKNPADDEHYRQWTLDAMKELEPITVGQYWGDSDQQYREVKVLADDDWARLQEVRSTWDPDERFVDYLAGPDGFQNRNGWVQE